MKNLLVMCLLVLGFAVLTQYGSSTASAAPVPQVTQNGTHLDPDRYILIDSATPYTVPVGKVLLLTSMTSASTSSKSVRINGLGVAISNGLNTSFPFSVPGTLALAGDVVTVDSGIFAYGKTYIPI